VIGLPPEMSRRRAWRRLASSSPTTLRRVEAASAAGSTLGLSGCGVADAVVLRRAAQRSKSMIPTATRLMHRRHVSRRASSYLRSSCSTWSQRWTASACGRVMWTTNRGSGMAPLTSIRGVRSRTAWISTGSGMSAGHERASSTNRQHSGASLIETSAGSGADVFVPTPLLERRI
jgi:hypothetical protein